MEDGCGRLVLTASCIWCGPSPYVALYMSSSRTPECMRCIAPWADWGREWLEWVEEDDSEFEREWREWKSRPGTFVGNICMLTAVISRRRGSGAAGVDRRGKLR
jgi:hypothetical protein